STPTKGSLGPLGPSSCNVDGTTGVSTCTATINYTPTNANGPDSFTFKVFDGTVDSPPATVSINTIPVAADQSLSVTKNVAKVITLSGTDSDVNNLILVIVNTQGH